MNRLDERWDRLAAGELSETEHDELRGLADATGEGYEAYQAFKPLGAAFQQNVAAAILAQREREEDAKAEEAAAAAAAAAASKKMDPAAPPRVPERRGIFKWAGALAAATTLAAGVLIFMPQRGIGPAPSIYIGGSRPTTTYRGAKPETLTFTATGTPQLVFGGTFNFSHGELPETGLKEALYLKQGNKLVVLPLEFQQKDTLDVPSTSSLEAGPAKLVYLLYRPGKEPSDEQLLEEIERPKNDPHLPWRVALRDVVLVRL